MAEKQKKLGVGVLLGQGQSLLAKTILRLMPVKKDETPDLTEFDWKVIRQSFRAKHLAIAIFAIAGVLVLNKLFYTVPILQLSIASAIGESIQFLVNTIIGHPVDISFWLLFSLIYSLILFRDEVGSIIGIGPKKLLEKLPSFAMREELVFRVGSEHWNLIQKIRAGVAFGLLHFTMIIVPLSTTLALSFGGFVFMGVYLAKYKKTTSVQEAARESAIVHTVYNMVILTTALTLLVCLLIITMVLSVTK